MKTYLLVALGGALGAMGRHAVGALVSPYAREVYPFATLAVNVSGSFALGVFAAWGAFSLTPGQEWRTFVVVGLLGGYTTFSAFSLEIVLLFERGRPGLAALYVAATILFAVGGLFAGLRLTRAILQ